MSSALLNTSPFVAQQGSNFFLNSLQTVLPQLIEPITFYTWTRDVNVRPDSAFIANTSSFRTLDFFSRGKDNASIPYVNSGQTAYPAVDTTASQFDYPVYTLGWSVQLDAKEEAIMDGMGASDVARAAEVQQIIQWKQEAAKLAFQKDMNELAYVGDPTKSFFGLFNQPNTIVTDSSLVAPATVGGTDTQWDLKQPIQILQDILEVIGSIRTRNAITSNLRFRIILSPYSYNILNKDAGGMGYTSIFNYVKSTLNCEVDILCADFLETAGVPVSGVPTRRMFVQAIYMPQRDILMHVSTPFVTRPVPQVGNIIYPFLASFSPVQLTVRDFIAYRDGI